MPPKTNWDSAETWQRLVAAIFATGVKIDLHDVAKMYGTTYDTIQNRYRKIRVEADALREEVDSGRRGDVATPRKKNRPMASTPTPRKSKPVKDALSSVTNGRVAKASPKTPKKKSIKQEKVDAAAPGDGAGEDDIFHGIEFGADYGDVSMDGDEFGV